MNEIFVKLANMSVAAGWLILAVLVLRLALKKAPRWITCLLWAAVAVRLVCPVSLQSPVSAYQVAAPAAVQPSGQVAYFQYVHAGGDKPSIQLDVDAIRPVAADGGPTVTDAAGIDERPVSGTVTRYLPPYVALWLAVGAALLLYGLASTLRLRLRVREAVRLRDNVWECDAVTSPFLLGVFRPRVYLPSGMEEGQMAYVLAHERAHLRRLDHIWKPLAYVLLAVHWFNPLVWLAYLLFCRDIETACDQRVIRDLDLAEKKAYSAALLQCSQGRRMVLACPVAFGEEGVRGRIKAVLHYKKPAFWVILVALIACVAVAVCFLTDPVSGGRKGTLTFVEKEPVISNWRADFAVDNSDAALSAVLYADVWRGGERESTQLLTMSKDVNELSIQVTRPERNEQMLPMFSLWVVTDAYGGYGRMSDRLKEMPKDAVFAAYQDGEKRQAAAGDTIVLAAMAADFGGGLPEFDCRKLEKQPDLPQSADYMIVIRAFFALSEADDGPGETLVPAPGSVPSFPLSETVVAGAIDAVGLPLAISAEETQSYTEGQIAYTLRSSGEDLYPWGAVSSAVYDGGKRFCQVTHLEAAGEDIAFHWEDWQKTITLAGMLWGGFDDDDQLYRQLSDLNIPDDSVTGASWEAETDGGFCRVSYSVTMIQSKPSHVNFTIMFYESQQEYRQMMKESMQQRETLRLQQNQLLEQTD